MNRGRKGHAKQGDPEGHTHTAQEGTQDMPENDTNLMEDDDMAFYSEITRPTEQKDKTEEEDQI